MPVCACQSKVRPAWVYAATELLTRLGWSVMGWKVFGGDFE
jgi:hypothetical protein